VGFHGELRVRRIDRPNRTIDGLSEVAAAP
jgi:hypothetical protein